MISINMEKYQWINPDNHSIAVDDQKQPVLNENGDLIVLDNESGKCIAVPNTDDVLEIFGFGYSTGYGSPSGSPKDSPERDMKSMVLNSDSEPLLWSMRTPCQKDIEATKEMLALVGSKKFQDMFNDQCTVKIRVWKRICEELMNKGFRIADSVNEGGIKCHQKWRNLEKSYRNYLISSTDPNSSAPKKPPPYFEALHDILKRKKKYANAATYTQTVVIGDELIETDAQVLQNHLNDSDQLEELDEMMIMEGQNDDHCYVVNSSGHVSKRFKMEPLTVCSTTSGGAGAGGGSVSGGGGGSGSGGGGGSGGGSGVGGGGGDVGGSSSSPSSRRHVQQEPADVLEQILEQIVRVHRDTLAMHDRHFLRMEKLMKENAAQTRRLADVMSQLLHSSPAEDCGGGKNKSEA